MTKLRPTLRLYLSSVVAVGAVAVVAAVAGSAHADPAGTPTFVILVVLAAVAKARPVHLSIKMKITVDDAPLFAAALLLGPAGAMLNAAGATLLGLLLGPKMPVYNRLFNAASSALSTGTAAVVYAALAGPSSSATALAAAVSAAAVAGYLAQTALVDIAVALQLRRDPLRSWWRVHRADVVPEAALYAVGATVALLGAGQIWVLLFIALPMVVVLLVLREWTRMRGRTRATLVQLADLIDKRDRYTYGHSQRVADLAQRLATRMRLAPSQIELITEAARLHDIGKVTTPDGVLQKRGGLNAHEWDVMHRHSEEGYQILQQVSDFWEGAELVRAHHERPDGRGYPRGARGLELPIEASIISVCDAYDAMTSDRVYRKALPLNRVRAELLAGRGTQWHAEVVDALLGLVSVESYPDKSGLDAFGGARRGAAERVS